LDEVGLGGGRVVTYRFPIKGKNLSQALPLERQENLPSWRLA